VNPKGSNVNTISTPSIDSSDFNNNLSQLAYDSRVREMQENIELYKNIKINNTALLYRLDGGIAAPLVPISPRKGLILFFSTVLGLIAGTSFVFFKAFLTEWNLDRAA
jgi:LPS O-antigen subunit length determinant protein (WzzB/FepE family)